MGATSSAAGNRFASRPAPRSIAKPSRPRRLDRISDAGLRPPYAAPGLCVTLDDDEACAMLAFMRSKGSMLAWMAMAMVLAMSCDTGGPDVMSRSDAGRLLETTIQRACATECPPGFTVGGPGPEPATCTADCGTGGSVSCTGVECGAVDGAGCHAQGSTGKTTQLKLCLTDAPPPQS